MESTTSTQASLPPKYIALYSPYSVQECQVLLSKYVSGANVTSFLSSNKLAGHIEGTHIRLWINTPRTWSSLSGEIQPYQNGTMIEGVFNDVGDTGRPAKYIFVYSIAISLFVFVLDYVFQLLVREAVISLLPLSGAILFFGILVAFVFGSLGSGSINDRRNILLFLNEILLTQTLETSQRDQEKRK